MDGCWPSGRAKALRYMLLVAGAAAWATASVVGGQPPPPGSAATTATEAEARELCGTACHRYPPPDILPRSEWREEIAKMTLFRQGNPVPPGPPGTLSRIVALPPDMEKVLRFYTSHAPEALPLPEAWPAVEHVARAGIRAPRLRARASVEDAVGVQRALCRHRSRRQARARRHRDELWLRAGRATGRPAGTAAGNRGRHPASLQHVVVRPRQRRT